MIKIRFTYLIILISLFTVSCGDSNNDDINDEITVSISDYSTNVDENTSTGISLGTVVATTNQGSLIFSIIEQTPNNALEINSSSGEITVLTESLFDYETYPTITGTLKAENSGVSDTANITINLNDINETIDDYKLLAVTDLGKVFEIGNNTGNIENVGQINRENESTFLTMGDLIASDDKIFAIEWLGSPTPRNNLLIYDRETGTTQIEPLVIPSSIGGSGKMIIALAWDGDNLIGVLSEDDIFLGSTKHIININLEDLSVTDLGITFNEDYISSMKKIDSKLYLSTWGQGLLEIDLISNSVNNISSINGSRMAVIDNSKIAIMQPTPGSANGANPGIYNLLTQTVTDDFSDETYFLVTVFGNSIYKNQVYLNLIASNDLNLYLGILKTNFETNENSIVEINSTDFNRNLIIVGTTE